MSSDRDGEMRSEHRVHVRTVFDAEPRLAQHVAFTVAAVPQEPDKRRHHHDQSRLHAGKEEALPVLSGVVRDVRVGRGPAAGDQ